MRASNFFIILLIILLLAVIFTKEDTLKIGYIGPLSGGVSFIGEDEVRAIEFSVNKINKESGINGEKVEIIFEDGKCDPKEAAIAADKLINIDKVKIILGGFCSGETLAIAPIAETNKVILLSTQSASPDITNAGEYVFRTFPSDAYRGKKYAELIKSMNITKVATLTEQTSFAKGLQDTFKKEFERYNGKIIAEEYSFGATDFKVQLEKIKNENPEAIFVIAQGGNSGLLAIKQIKEMGMNITLFGTYVFLSESVLKTAENSAEGMKILDSSSKIQDRGLVDEYEELFDRKPSYTSILGAKYDALNILKDSIEECKEVNTECIKDYLYNITEYNGLIGNYSFDENGDVVGVKHSLWEISNGKAVDKGVFN